ncbi:MAG: DinB family protein [Planctomycetes bacterium]|nr:DinB family protein [Planctomycetota bacterium]
MPPKLTKEYVTIHRDILVERMISEHKSALRVVAACPEEQLGYKQHERNRTFAEIAQHIFLTGPFFVGAIEAGVFPNMGDGKEPAPPTKKAALLAACEAMAKQAEEGTRKLSVKQLMGVLDFMGMCAFPAIEYLQWHLNHLIHTRAQLTSALRTMGAKVPPVYGPSADTTEEEMGQLMAEMKAASDAAAPAPTKRQRAATKRPRAAVKNAPKKAVRAKASSAARKGRGAKSAARGGRR